MQTPQRGHASSNAGGISQSPSREGRSGARGGLVMFCFAPLLISHLGADPVQEGAAGAAQLQHSPRWKPSALYPFAPSSALAVWHSRANSKALSSDLGRAGIASCVLCALAACPAREFQTIRINYTPNFCTNRQGLLCPQHCSGLLHQLLLSLSLPFSPSSCYVPAGQIRVRLQISSGYCAA